MIKQHQPNLDDMMTAFRNDSDVYLEVDFLAEQFFRTGDINADSMAAFFKELVRTCKHIETEAIEIETDQTGEYAEEHA